MPPRRDDFADVYDDHVWDVYGFFGYRLASREECEDLTQQTFLRALGAWKRFDPERATAKTWLLAIARNLLVDHYRKGGGVREEPRPVEELPEAGVSEPHDRELGLSAELESALRRLGDRERELIALRFGGDLGGPEIAAMTGLSLANVQQILSRALRKLRGELEPADEDRPAVSS